MYRRRYGVLVRRTRLVHIEVRFSVGSDVRATVACHTFADGPMTTRLAGAVSRMRIIITSVTASLQ